MVGRGNGSLPDRRRDRRRRLWPFVVGAVLLSIAAGVGREIVQNWGDTDGSLGDSIVDAVAWSTGAVIAGGVALVILRRKGVR